MADNYFTRSASGLQRGLSAILDSISSRSKELSDGHLAAIRGYRAPPGSMLTEDDSGRQFYVDENNREVAPERVGNLSRMIELAGGATPSGKLSQGLTAIFAGTKARTANHAAHALAQEMEKAGATRDAIWGATGWFKAPDGHWKFEIHDAGARYRPEPSALPDAPSSVLRQQLAPDQLGTYFHHPELYDAYPKLAKTQFDVVPQRQLLSQTARAAWTPGSIELSEKVAPALAKRSILHELQHAVAHGQGFATGGNPTMAFRHPEASGILAQIRNEMLSPPTLENFTKSAGFKSSKEAEPYWRQHVKDLSDMRRSGLPTHLEHSAQETAADQFYRRLAGEVESRAVEARMGLTREERATRPPWWDYDVPEADQIVKFRGYGPSERK